MPSNKRYNGAPSLAYAVITQIENRKIEHLRWGLIPGWAKDRNIAYKMINARRETLREKPSFRKPFRSRRCIVPVNGFYEWQKSPEGKIPTYISATGSGVLAFAGLWESWRDPADSQADPLRTFTIITTGANAFMQTIHERMPLILLDEEVDVWLNTASSESDLCHLLERPVPETMLRAHTVSRQVNNPRFDDPTLIEAV